MTINLKQTRASVAGFPTFVTLGRKKSAPELPKHLCVYCGALATTRDHVPPRLLLERPFPPNLRTVPSCLDCNRGASKDEEYFLALIAYASSSPHLAAKLEPGGTIDRAFTRSPKLEMRYLEAMGVDEETGKPYINAQLPRVETVVKKIAIGLFAIRYGWSPPQEDVRSAQLFPYGLQDDRPAKYFISMFTDGFQSKRWKWKSVQSGVFSYIFVRNPNHPASILCIFDCHKSFWGVAHLPRSRRGKIRNSRQLSLFEMQIFS